MHRAALRARPGRSVGHRRHGAAASAAPPPSRRRRPAAAGRCRLELAQRVDQRMGQRDDQDRRQRACGSRSATAACDGASPPRGIRSEQQADGGKRSRFGAGGVSRSSHQSTGSAGQRQQHPGCGEGEAAELHIGSGPAQIRRLSGRRGAVEREQRRLRRLVGAMRACSSSRPCGRCRRGPADASTMRAHSRRATIRRG